MEKKLEMCEALARVVPYAHIEYRWDKEEQSFYMEAAYYQGDKESEVNEFMRVAYQYLEPEEIGSVTRVHDTIDNKISYSFTVGRTKYKLYALEPSSVSKVKREVYFNEKGELDEGDDT
jgi:hypothetical protein